MYLLILKNVFLELRKGVWERRIGVNILRLPIQCFSPTALKCILYYKCIPTLPHTDRHWTAIRQMHYIHKCITFNQCFFYSTEIINISVTFNLIYVPGFKDWQGQRLYDALRHWVFWLLLLQRGERGTQACACPPPRHANHASERVNLTHSFGQASIIISCNWMKFFHAIEWKPTRCFIISCTNECFI